MNLPPNEKTEGAPKLKRKSVLYNAHKVSLPLLAPAIAVPIAAMGPVVALGESPRGRGCTLWDKGF